MSRKSKKRLVVEPTKTDEQLRLDGYRNLATGLGTARDKRTWGTYSDVTILEDTQLENIYAGNDLAAKIVDWLPEDAMRGGYDLVYEGQADDVTDLRRGIEQRMRAIEATEKVTSALCWGRLYGGGAVLLGAADGVSDLTIPLDDSRVTDLRFLNDLERRDFQPVDWYDDPREQGYGQPEIYALTPQGQSRSGGVEVSAIHETRMIETFGARTPARYRQRNRGWTLSVLQRVHEVLRDFEQAFGSVGNMLLDASQGVISIEGLIRSIGAVGASVIEARMASIDLYKSSSRMLVLDSQGEKYENVERTFTGIEGMLALFMLRMSSAADMSVTRLFKRSPAGLSATGESDLENDYATTMGYQQHVVKPILERIARVTATSLGSPDPESWSVEFPSLWVEGPKELAERRKLIADRDVAYISAQVYEPEEVALARATGWDSEIVIDEDARRRQLELDVSRSWEAGEDEDEDEVPEVAEEAPEVAEEMTEPEAVDPTTALNGAQVTSLKDIVLAVANRELPRDTGVAMMAAAFPISEAQADDIMGTVGESFFNDEDGDGDDVASAADDAMRLQMEAAEQARGNGDGEK